MSARPAPPHTAGPGNIQLRCGGSEVVLRGDIEVVQFGKIVAFAKLNGVQPGIQGNWHGAESSDRIGIGPAQPAAAKPAAGDGIRHAAGADAVDGQQMCPRAAAVGVGHRQKIAAGGRCHDREIHITIRIVDAANRVFQAVTIERSQIDAVVGGQFGVITVRVEPHVYKVEFRIICGVRQQNVVVVLHQ